MHGKKEKKLVVKEGKIEKIRIIAEILKTLDLLDYTDDELLKKTMRTSINLYYKDSYYDDENSSLLKSGGSLKLREEVNNTGSKKQTFIMRMRTSNPQKLKVSGQWEEAGINTICRRDIDFYESLNCLKACFKDFDFSKIKSKAVLVCSTIRAEYTIIWKGAVISVLIDHIDYESEGAKASDDLVKIRTTSNIETIVESIYDDLRENFNNLELLDQSRYERALNKLKETTDI